MDPYQISGKRILFSPLNWGLGHATRSAKLIHHLSKKNKLVIASDGAALQWLTVEFPDLKTIELPELRMRYSKRFGAIGGIIRRLPHFFRSIQKDYKAISKLLEKEDFDLIISDNRYGVYNEQIPSYLITHQLRFMHPLSMMISNVLQNFIEKFDEVWVPDDESQTLSGELSKPENGLGIPISYIGSLSRFNKNIEVSHDIKFLLIASGPEPFQSQMLGYFEHNLSLIKDSCHIVSSLDVISKADESKNIVKHYRPSSELLEKLIERSEYVICRSGYSSIMDLIEKNQNAILIPTPGQIEQIYLANYHKNNPLFKCVLKAKDLSVIMKELM